MSQGDWNKERVIACASKSFSVSQRNWVTYDREWWAIIWSIRHFRGYLAGRRFTVVTNHKPLIGSRNIDPGSDPAGRRARWANELSSSKHTNADALSRLPVETVHNVQDDAMEDLRVLQQVDPEISQLRGWFE